MKNLKLGTRLQLGFGITTVFLLTQFLMGKYGMQSNMQGLESIYNNSLKSLQYLGESRSAHDENRVLLSGLANAPSESANKILAKIVSNSEKFDRGLSKYAQLSISPKEKVLLDKINSSLQSYRNERATQLGPQLKSAESASVKEPDTNKAVLLSQEVSALLLELIELKVALADAQYHESKRTDQTILVLKIIGTALAIGLAIFLGWFITRSITKPVSQAVKFSEALAKGDLSVSLSADSKDEIGELMASMQKMQENLSHLVERVRNGSQNVSNASSEIAESNHDLSARTEDQAIALQQSAQSMEELVSTVEHNADNARKATQLANIASSVAVEGGGLVQKVVATMQGINESSKKISEITSVIDGIAFQTNILALNAAVEAARAGEQGRGFAVVASEVRSLAGRSAAAAKDIKELINDSVTRIEEGSAQVGKAGETMTEVVTSIKHVNDMVSEISAAGVEQSKGLAQVSAAVTKMDDVTQQNAALVEQMAAAASSLKGQSIELVGTVSVFKLKQDHVLVQSGSNMKAVLPIEKRLEPVGSISATEPKNSSMLEMAIQDR